MRRHINKTSSKSHRENNGFILKVLICRKNFPKKLSLSLSPPINTITDKKLPGQKPPDNKPPSIIEDIIAKYAVDANLSRLRSTNPKKIHFLFFFCFYTGDLLSGVFVRGLFVGGRSINTINVVIARKALMGAWTKSVLCLFVQ